jgi:hypothetical protein
MAERGITTGRLVRSVDRHGNIGTSLTGQAFGQALRSGG